MNRLVGCLVLAVVMVTAAWAGAVTSTAASTHPSEDAETWSIPAITPGERAVYTRGGNENLEIQVTNTTITTRDGFGQPVEAILVEQIWRPEDGVPDPLLYAVDPDSGAVLWTGSNLRTYQWRSLPFLWGGSVLADRDLSLGEELRVPLWARTEPFEAVYEVGQPVDRSDGTVLPVHKHWDTGDAPDPVAWWVTPWTIEKGNRTLEFGGDHGFPIRILWDSGHVHWKLVEHEPGNPNETAWRASEDPPEPPWKEHPNLPFANASRTGPPPETTGVEYWPISLQEAHEFAWTFSDGLRQFRLQHDDEVVLVGASPFTDKWGVRLERGPASTDHGDRYLWKLTYQAIGEKDQWWVTVELKRWTVLGLDVPEHKMIRSEGSSNALWFDGTRLPAGERLLDFGAFADRAWEEHGALQHAGWWIRRLPPMGPLIPMEGYWVYEHEYASSCQEYSCDSFSVEIDPRTGMVDKVGGSAVDWASFEDRWVGPGWLDWLGEEADREIEQPPSIASSASASASGSPRLEIGSVVERCGPSVLDSPFPGNTLTGSLRCFP